MSRSPDAGGPTGYLPIGRVSAAGLSTEVTRAADHPLVNGLLGVQRSAVVIVDGHRQIVASNLRFLALAGVKDPGSLLGLRFGETFGCVGADEGPDGCGTARRCAGCGAAFATLAGLRERGGERECSLRVDRGGRTEDLALRVVAVPFRVAGDVFTALFVSDVTGERGRSRAERAWVSDAVRLSASLHDACEALRASGEPEDLERVQALAEQVRGELAVQALLAGDEPEAGGFPPPRTVEVRPALRRLAAALRAHPASGGRTVELDATLPGAKVVAEPAALHHVLLRMAVNAMEATRAGGTVRVTVAEGAHETWLRVWNDGVVPAAVRPRLFQRYFSTKGPGRGSGTWAMQLLAERVLGGRVEYTTSPGEGTWFVLVLPRG